MKSFKFLAIPFALSLMMVGCKGNNNNDGNFPENFNSIGDAGRVQYVIENAEPDSVARFIYFGALGRVPGVKIDTLGIAITRANEVYTGEQLEAYYREVDNIKSQFSLTDKLKIYNLEGYEDPSSIGFTLGLEYMQTIRERNMKTPEIKGEIESLRKACSSDPETFNRFLVGFREVLKNDRGKDLPAEIYNAFINYN